MKHLMITLSISWINITAFKAIKRPGDVTGVCIASTSIRLVITTRTSWMANNAMPDSIIMNMIFRSLVPPVASELNEPNVRSIELVSGLSCLTSKNTVRILNTIKPVTRAFTTMDAAKLVRVSVFPQTNSSSSNVIAPSDASQVARGDKLKSAYQLEMKID